MKQVIFASTENKVSQYCLGCMLMGTAMDKKTAFAVLDHFREQGGVFLDTANCYSWWMGGGEYIGDESENVIGEWLSDRGCRDEIFLATKVGGRLKDVYGIRVNGEIEWHRVRQEYEGLSAAVIKKGVEGSLKRLKTDRIDLYYAHVFDEVTPLEETMEAFTKLIKEGKVRFIGCSNITAQKIEEANRLSKEKNYAQYMAMQQEYSYLHPDTSLDTGIVEHADSRMFECMKEQGMAFLAYSPLLKGIYGDKEKRETYYNRHLYDNEKSREKLALVDKLALELGVTGNQLALAWLLRHDPQIIPIIGFSHKSQYLENMKALDIDLPDEYLAMLNALD